MRIWRTIAEFTWPRRFWLRYLITLALFLPLALIATAAVGSGVLGLTADQLGGGILGISGLSVLLASLPVALGAEPGTVIWKTNQDSLSRLGRHGGARHRMPG